MIFTSSKDRSIMDKVEKVISRKFHIDSQRFIEKDTSDNVSLARSYLFYILHYDYNFSAAKISDNYFRTIRAVFFSLSKIGYRIKNQRIYKDMYNEIVNNI